MMSSFSVYFQVAEVANNVLSVRVVCPLNLEPVDLRLFSQRLVGFVVPAHGYRVIPLYDGTFLVISCESEGVHLASPRDLVCRDDFKMCLDLTSGSVSFLFAPVDKDRDLYWTPTCTTITYRGTFEFVSNGSNEVSEE